MRLTALVVLAFCAPLLATAGQRYVVDSHASSVTIEVGRAGFLKFAGHEHRVLARSIRGEVDVDRSLPESSSVHLTFPITALEVSGEGEPAQDVPKVQARMTGPDVLDVARFPVVDFRSTGVSAHHGSGSAWTVTVAGELSLHGIQRPVQLQIDLDLEPAQLVARGRAELKQKEFGIEPVSVAGVVKVRNELRLQFRIVARAERESSARTEHNGRSAPKQAP